MTLSQALVEMAPPDRTLSPEENQRRERAIVMVFEELSRLARRVVEPAHRDELVSNLLYRLMKNRPGPRRYTADDEGARAYLVRGLRNQEKDAHRRDARQANRCPDPRDRDSRKARAPEDEDFVDPETPDDNLQQDERARLEAEATRQLFDLAIPAISRSLQNPTGFLANMADLRAIFDGTLSVDQIVAREGGTPETYTTVRNRVYQRHKRARAYLLEVPRNRPDDVPRLTAWLTRAGLPSELTDEVRRVANEVFAPRVDRGEAALEEQVS
ncbi:hypothetical protein [Luteitalea sp. TBR-22]|uniref:hypothetical protein n=1 Tax=Luteitalea sp. TBR-22 TaxID=2802971 RepID=UPI001EF57359|nr:hypothetical protein [Luteitalea sp. TBR-22]